MEEFSEKRVGLSLVAHHFNEQFNKQFDSFRVLVQESTHRENKLKRKIEEEFEKNIQQETTAKRLVQSIKDSYERNVKKLKDCQENTVKELIQKHECDIRKVMDMFIEKKEQLCKEEHNVQLLDDENYNLKMTIRNHEKEKRNLKQQLEESQKTLEESQKKVEESQKTVEEYRKTLEETKQTQTIKEKEHRDDLAERDSRLAKYREVIEKFEEEKSIQNRIAEQEKINKQRYASGTSSILSIDCESIGDYETRPKSLEVALKTTGKLEIDLNEEKLKKMQHGNRYVPQNIEVYQCSVASDGKATDLKTTLKELEETKSREVQHKRKITKLQTCVENMIKEIEDVKKSNVGLTITLQNRQVQIDTLKEENEKLVKTVSQQKNVMELMQNRYDGMLNDCQSKITEKPQRTDLKSRLKEAQKLNTEFREKCDELASQLTIKTIQIQDFLQQNNLGNDCLKVELENEKKKCAKLEKRIVELEQHDVDSQYLRKRLKEIKEEAAKHLTKIGRLEKEHKALLYSEHNLIAQNRNLLQETVELKENLFYLKQREDQEQRMLAKMAEKVSEHVNINALSGTKKKKTSEKPKDPPCIYVDKYHSLRKEMCKLQSDYTLSIQQVQKLSFIVSTFQRNDSFETQSEKTKSSSLLVATDTTDSDSFVYEKIAPRIDEQASCDSTEESSSNIYQDEDSFSFSDPLVAQILDES